jgi:hypothetical protein
MSETLTPQYTKRDYLSITTLLEFVRCPRRHFYRKSGLVPRDADITALVYGSAMHKAVPICLTEGLKNAFEAFSSVWDEKLANDKRSTQRAYAQLSHFYHTHSGGRSIYSFEKPPRGDIALEEETSPLEVPAVIDVGLPIPLFVRIDGLVRHRDTGELWGWEFKTASRLNASLFEAMEFSPQVLSYTMALRTITGLDVRGMMAEGMLIDKAKVDNMLHPIPVQEHLMADILRWLKYWGSLLLACEEQYTLQGAEAFVKNFAGCTPYVHHYTTGWPCEYMNLCRVPDYTQMISYYDVKEDHKAIKLPQLESKP